VDDFKAELAAIEHAENATAAFSAEVEGHQLLGGRHGNLRCERPGRGLS
jgi:hypothetical protein